MVWLWLLCRPSASQRLWKVWREQRERRKGKGRARERARGGKVLLNNKAWLPSREPSLASGVSLHSCLSLILYVCLSALLSFSHTVFLDNLFLSERPIFNTLSTVSYFESTLLLLFYLSTRPSPPYLSTLTCGGQGRTEQTKPLNLGLSFTQEVSHCVWGASWRCHMSWHSKSQGLRMWVIWSRGTKVCCLPMNGAFSYWHGEKRVNKHQRLGATLKCSAVFFSAPHLYKPVII